MSNFICEKCGMTNIDCGFQGYKTEREIELEKQLDREIKINRKMKSALKVYANEKNWSYNFVQYLAIWGEGREDRKDGPYIAQQVLKEIDNKE